MAEPANHYTVASLAEELGCSKDHIYNLVHRGQIPFVKFGNLIRFPRLKVQEFIEAQWQNSLNVTAANITSSMPAPEPEGQSGFQHALQTAL